MSELRQKFLAFRVYHFRDADAFRQIHDLYVARLKRYVVMKVPQNEADELTSEVFLRAWEYMTSDKVDHVGALLYKIARNMVADFYRRRKPTENLTPEMEENIPARGSLVSEAAVKEEAADLMRRMTEISEQYRELITMRYLDEMSISEIAAIYGKTSNHIRVLLHRAKLALRKKI